MFRLKCQCGKEHEVPYGMGGTLKCECGYWIQWVLYPTTTTTSSALGQLIFNNPIQLPTIKSNLPIIGFRSWQYYEDKLYSNNRQFGHWEPGVNEAYCHATSKHPSPGVHEAPDEHCDCGIYVLATMDRLENGPWGLYDGTRHVDNEVPRIVGAVMGWGKVVAHEPEGWRASHARVLGLLDTSSTEWQRITMECLAEYYEVPLLTSERNLKMFAMEYGETLAEKMRQQEA